MSRVEESIIDAELTPPFSVIEPENHTAPLVFNSPHSGRTYPSAFLNASRLDPMTLRKSEDAYVDQLFMPVVGLGAPLMHAHFPRAYLDVNREPYELDPVLIADDLPHYANTQSMRVIGGLGTVARVVTDQEEIYREPMKLDAALYRIKRLYEPYHDALGSLLARCQNTFGFAILIDCHSMPSNPSNDRRGVRPDFVLGDRFGASCNPELTQFIMSQLRAMGYVVEKNQPYAGGYITEHYGRPDKGMHALQIEVNRALYLDEFTLEFASGYAVLRKNLMLLTSALFSMSPEIGRVPRWAAE